MEENKTVQAEAAEIPSALTETEPAGFPEPVGEPGVDEDAILPEGWKPEDNGESGNPDALSPEDANLYRLFGLNPDGREKKADDAETPPNPEAETKPESVPDSQTPENAEPPTRETEPDYKALYEQLLRSTQDAKGRETFRQVYAEQKAAGMSDAAARLVAKDAAGGKEFPLTDETDTSGKAENPDYAAALNQLHGMFPDVKEIPAEVTKAMMEGGDPVSVYMGWQRAQDRKTIGELQAKIRDMEQKASNTVRAVARGVSGNGAKQETEDNFLKGMMAEDW